MWTFWTFRGHVEGWTDMDITLKGCPVSTWPVLSHLFGALKKEP